MTRNRFIFCILFFGAAVAAIRFTPHESEKRLGASPDAGHMGVTERVQPPQLQPHTEEKTHAASPEALKSLDQTIDSLAAEIRIRQITIEREQVVKMLNENRINSFERQIYFDLLNAQANAQTKMIELRLKRLRLMVEQGSAT